MSEQEKQRIIRRASKYCIVNDRLCLKTQEGTKLIPSFAERYLVL